MVRSVLVAVVVSAAASAQEIYRWTDSHGTVHYTDDPASIPQGAKAATTQGAELSSITVTRDPKKEEPGPGPRQPVPVAIAAPEPVDVQALADEERWRSAFKAAHKKVRDLEDELAVDQPRVDSPGSYAMGGQYVCPPGYFGRMYPYGYRGGYRQGAALGAQVNVPAGKGGSLTVNGTASTGFDATHVRGRGFVTPGSSTLGPCYWLPDGSYDGWRDQLEHTKVELARAKEELADLERKAANEAVPLEWRR